MKPIKQTKLNFDLNDILRKSSIYIYNLDPSREQQSSLFNLSSSSFRKLLMSQRRLYSLLDIISVDGDFLERLPWLIGQSIIILGFLYIYFFIGVVIILSYIVFLIRVKVASTGSPNPSGKQFNLFKTVQPLFDG